MANLVGGHDTKNLVSLSGLADVGDVGVIVDQSGDYVNPLMWKSGIRGLNAVKTLTPGIHGLMDFPGSGGADPLLSNPIHSALGMSGLGCGCQSGGNSIYDSGCNTQPEHALSTGLSGIFDSITADPMALLLGVGAIGLWLYMRKRKG